MDEDEDDKSSQVGSPSPPYEGVITEEPEKQLESQGGDFDVAETNGEVDEVNILLSLTTNKISPNLLLSFNAHNNTNKHQMKQICWLAIYES